MLAPQHPDGPRYWMWESSDVLREAVRAYEDGDDMTPGQIAAMAAYLRQWIATPSLGYQSPIQALRLSAATLYTRDAIARWIWRAAGHGLNPL
jgi:hypothetical protein